MTDDLAYLNARIPDYREYGNEADRSDSDMRIRAFVGSRLSDVQARLGDALDAATNEKLEAVLLRCIFTDQVFVRNFEHAELDPPMVAALVRADRSLVETAERLEGASIAELPALLQDIDGQLDYRRAPAPVAK